MKAMLMAIFPLVSVSISSAQGLVYFANFSSSGPVNAPVYRVDGVTALAGPQFMAELFGGSSSSNLVLIASTGFATQGYFNAGDEQISTVPPHNLAWVQVDVWNTTSGASFDQAQSSGLPDSWWQSSIFTVRTGGGGVNPAPPALLTGLGTSPVYLNGVPEPSVLTLGAFAAALALLRFSKRRTRHP